MWLKVFLNTRRKSHCLCTPCPCALQRCKEILHIHFEQESANEEVQVMMKAKAAKAAGESTNIQSVDEN